MRPLAAALLAAAVSIASVEAAERYVVATRSAPRGRDIRTFHSINAYAATLTDDEVAQLRKSPDVRFISRVVERRISASSSVGLKPDSTSGTNQRMPYGIAMIRAPEVWTATKGGGPVNVAVIDTGIDTRHPDLAANYAGGYNAITGSDDPGDDHGHGTHVAGTIAALDNDSGVVGVAPETHVWAVKVLDRLGVGSDENIAAGVDWVIQKKRESGGDWVMSLSLGGDMPSPVEEEAFTRAISEGILVVAAAGNSSSMNIQYPAAYDGVIAVGAIDSAGSLAAFSDFGKRLDVVAPGVGVLSTALEGTAPSAVMTLSTGATFAASSVEGSTAGDIEGRYVVCGTGHPDDFPAKVKGNIALIRRGDITFNEKVKNAQAAGATSVILYNYDDSAFATWTLCGGQCDPDTHTWPIVLAISAADAQRLLADASQHVDMGTWVADYTAYSGTSQATPHVAGALALLWSLDPGAKAERVKDALLTTTTDLGAPGFDLMFGNGLINVAAAARKLAPWRFDIVPPPHPSDPLPTIR